jgi:hypothetical protein
MDVMIEKAEAVKDENARKQGRSKGSLSSTAGINLPILGTLAVSFDKLDTP